MEPKTWKMVPGAIVATALVLLPTSKLKAVKLAAPVPPLFTPNIPETSEADDRPTAPFSNEPDDDLTIPLPKLARVVEPLAAILNKDVPVEELTLKGFTPTAP